MPRKRKKPTEQERDNPTLASFQVNSGQWYDFGVLCESMGISASQGLALYINACLDAKKLIIESIRGLNIESDNLPNIESIIESADIKAELLKLVRNEISSHIQDYHQPREEGGTLSKKQAIAS